VKLAIVSDIHGNLPALAAVLADAARERVTAMINLGDILSGPLWPAETADRLMDLEWPTVAGNHERQVLAAQAEGLGTSDAYAASRLREPHLAWLAALPGTRWIGRTVFACHGTPASDVQYWLESTHDRFDPSAGEFGVRAATAAEVQERSRGVEPLEGAELMLCGHSHVPRCVRLDDGRLVLNPGSVGLPAFDDTHGHVHWVQAGAPHARYALAERGAHGWSVQLRAVAYDWQRAAAQALANGRSDWADALASGRVGRTEAEVDAAAIALARHPAG
jgi:predicted phosphodiesterase